MTRGTHLTAVYPALFEQSEDQSWEYGMVNDGYFKFNRYSSRINSRKSDILKDIKAAEKDLAVVEEKDSVKEDPQWTLSVTRDRHVEKEDLAEYIAKKREMFLVQYSLGVKRFDQKEKKHTFQHFHISTGSHVKHHSLIQPFIN